MIGAAVAIARTMGDDFLRYHNRHYGVLVQEYGGAVAIGLPALFIFGAVASLCGYVFGDDDGKKRNSRKRWRKQYRKKQENTRKL